MQIDGWGRSVGSTVHGERLLPQNVADSSGGGQDGYTISALNVIGASARLTVNNTEVVTYGNTLYAPTMRPEDPSCIEGTNIINSATSQNSVAFYTFCGDESLDNDGNDGYYGFLYYNDPNFSNYTATYNGLQVVTMQISQFPDGSWHGLLYNYATSEYEDRLAVNGSCNSTTHVRLDAPGGCNLQGGTPGGGWAMLETHYQSGLTCSTVTRKQVQNLQVLVGTTWSQASANPSAFTFHDYTNGAYGGGFYSYGACSAYSQYGTTNPWYQLNPGNNYASGVVWGVVMN